MYNFDRILSKVTFTTDNGECFESWLTEEHCKKIALLIDLVQIINITESATRGLVNEILWQAFRIGSPKVL